MKTPPMRSRVRRLALLIGLAICGIVTLTAAADAAPYCAGGKPVVFAGVNWDSGEFVTEVMREILSRGFGCRTQTIPGNAETLEQATADDDVQIFAARRDPAAPSRRPRF